jgi:hypothetical protein
MNNFKECTTFGCINESNGSAENLKLCSSCEDKEVIIRELSKRLYVWPIPTGYEDENDVENLIRGNCHEDAGRRLEDAAALISSSTKAAAQLNIILERVKEKANDIYNLAKRKGQNVEGIPSVYYDKAIRELEENPKYLRVSIPEFGTL